MAETLETVIEVIRGIQKDARAGGPVKRPQSPMIVMRTPKGWTGPKEVDGKKSEGSWRSHQVPFSDLASNREHIMLLENWMKSYKPEELFDEVGALKPELAAVAPKGNQRMGANPHANGGILLKELRMPDFRDYALDLPKPGVVTAEATRVAGVFLRDIMKFNQVPQTSVCLARMRRLRTGSARFLK